MLIPNDKKVNPKQDVEPLQKNNVILIGHNSRGYLDESATVVALKEAKELIKYLKDKIWSSTSKLSQSRNDHAASHGNDAYFKDEISNRKDLEKYACDPEYGVYRKPNPWEKKQFATKSFKLSEEASDDLYQSLDKIIEFQQKNGVDNE